VLFLCVLSVKDKTIILNHPSLPFQWFPYFIHILTFVKRISPLKISVKNAVSIHSVDNVLFFLSVFILLPAVVSNYLWIMPAWCALSEIVERWGWQQTLPRWSLGYRHYVGGCLIWGNTIDCSEHSGMMTEINLVGNAIRVYVGWAIRPLWLMLHQSGHFYPSTVLTSWC
jgi:hypothetical protein